MTKLLIIAPQNPYPPKDGGKIGIYYPVIHLAKYFEVHFIFITAEEVAADVYEHFKQWGVCIYPQVLLTKDSNAGYLTNFLQKLPYKFLKYYDERVYHNIATLVREKEIKNVWCNHPHVAAYALKLKQSFGLTIYLREHNIEYTLVEQVMQVSRNPLLKLLVYYQYRKTKRFELKCWESFNKVYFISNIDLATAEKEVGEKNYFAVLFDSFVKLERKVNIPVEPGSFIFTASVATFQNSYNLKRFIKEIWLPLIAKHNKWRLYITGNNDDDLKKVLNIDLEKYRIYNLGFVSDIATAIQSKKYFVSPSYIGSGVRIKVLNALSLGAVCFVTPLDAGMLNVLEDKENLVMFNDFLSFEITLTELERSENLYNQISLKASKAGTNFSWPSYAEIIYNDISTH